MRRLFGLLMALATAPAWAGGTAPGGPQVDALEATLEGARYRVTFALPVPAAGGGLTVPGLRVDDRGMPHAVVALEVPAGLEVVLESGSTVRGNLMGRLPTMPATRSEALPAHAGFPRGPVATPRETPLAVLEQAGMLGDRGFVLLRLYPLVPGDTGFLEYRREIVIELSFRGAARPVARGRAPDGIGALADRLLVPWTGPSPTATKAADAWDGRAEATEAVTPRVRIEVEAAGHYRVTGAELAAAGVPIGSIDPATFAMVSQGSPVAIRVIDGGTPGTFEVADEIRFYGVPMTGRFTRRNVYWLDQGGAPGPVMGERDAAPGGSATVPVDFPWSVHREENTAYTSNPPPGAANHWWWGSFLTAPTTFTIPGSGFSGLDLPGLSAVPHTVDLRAQIQGRSATQHHARLLLNAGLLDDQAFFGRVPILLQGSTGSAGASAAGNTVDIDLPGDVGPVDQIYIDFLEADYRRSYVATADVLEFAGEGPGTFEYQVAGFSAGALEVLDITDPLLPVRLTGFTISGTGPFTTHVEDSPAGAARYLAAEGTALLSPAAVVLSQPADLLDVANGADHIIIAPEGFLAAMEPLRLHRAGQGMRAMSVAMQDIYDLFSDGIFDPNAITAFLSHAYASWQAPAPSFVVLAGDANTDYLDYTGGGLPNHVPVVLVETPVFGETPSDNSYAMVSGGDLLPDLYVGRLPAGSPAAAGDMAAKIVAYETAPPFAALNAEALFVADDDEVSFSVVLDSRIDDFLPGAIAAHRVYLPLASGGAAENAEILAALDSGTLMTTYLGHGSVGFWAGEFLLQTSDVAGLAANDAQPFVAALNCINGYFSMFDPAFQYSLLEELIRQPDRGAIAGWGPAALTSVADYDLISFDLFDNLFVELEPRLGVAALDALIQAIAVYGVSGENAQEMIFFGDPATVFALDTDADQVADGLDNCPGLANPAQLDFDGDSLGDDCDPDDDNDSVDDGLDCADFDPGAWSLPVEAASLTVTGSADLAWDPQDLTSGPGVVYDVVRGGLTDLRSQGGIGAAGCMAAGIATPSASDALPPEPGGTYYLVRARNSCGDGGYGSATSGTPRISNACP